MASDPIHPRPVGPALRREDMTADQAYLSSAIWTALEGTPQEAGRRELLRWLIAYSAQILAMPFGPQAAAEELYAQADAAAVRA